MESTIEERASGILRGAGLRVTAPRVAVMTAMLRRHHPVSAADLIEDVGSLGLSEVTIYRNLNRLAEIGVLRRVDTTERRRRFEVAEGRANHEHPHFVCDACGEVTCLETDIEPLSMPELPAGYRVETQRVILHGRCDTCD